MRSFDEYRLEAEIAIDSLTSEVFYMGEFCAPIEDVKKVFLPFFAVKARCYIIIIIGI